MFYWELVYLIIGLVLGSIITLGVVAITKTLGKTEATLTVEEGIPQGVRLVPDYAYQELVAIDLDKVRPAQLRRALAVLPEVVSNREWIS